MFGECYTYEIGTSQNLAESFSWYSKAAEQGLCVAMFNIAQAYQDGKGCQQSIEKALIWYKKASSQGRECSYEIEQLEIMLSMLNS